MRISDWSSDVCSSDLLVDAIANAELIRSFARTEFERRFLGRYLEEESRRSVRLRWFLLLMRVFQLFAVVGLLATLLWVAFHDTVRGRIGVGTFTMVFTLGGLIAHSVWNLSHRLLDRSEEHTSELQSLMRISYAVFCLKKKN